MYREVLTNMSIQVSPNLYIEFWPIPLLVLAVVVFAIASFVQTEKPFVEQKVDKIEKEQEEIKRILQESLPLVANMNQKLDILLEK